MASQRDPNSRLHRQFGQGIVILRDSISERRRDVLQSEAIDRANNVFRRQMFGLSEYRRPARGATPKPMATEKNQTHTPVSAPLSGGALADLQRVQALRGISPTALTSPSKYEQTHGDRAKLSTLTPEDIEARRRKQCGISPDAAPPAFKGDQAGPSK